MLDERLLASKLKVMVFSIIHDEATRLRNKYQACLKYPLGYFIGKKYLIKSQALFDLTAKISLAKLHTKELAMNELTLIPLAEYERLKQLESKTLNTELNYGN